MTTQWTCALCTTRLSSQSACYGSLKLAAPHRYRDRKRLQGITAVFLLLWLSPCGLFASLRKHQGCTRKPVARKRTSAVSSAWAIGQCIGWLGLGLLRCPCANTVWTSALPPPSHHTKWWHCTFSLLWAWHRSSQWSPPRMTSHSPEYCTLGWPH